MNTPAHQIQGSDAWLEYRRTRGNASETAALMGCSPFYPRNAAELFDVKTGRKSVYENDAMRRGQRLEEPARAFLEGAIGDSFSPHVCEHDRLSASLDGVTFDGNRALEIKVPAKGRESDTWKYVRDHGRPPRNYWWQVQHQLLCSGADDCVFAVCEADADEHIVDFVDGIVTADADAQEQIRKAWTWFFEHLDADERPEDGKTDAVRRDDDEWHDAAVRYRNAKVRESEAKQEVEAAREQLMRIAGDTPAYGGGVRIQHVWTNGSIDYKAAVPKDADLEQYRKQGRWSARIDVDKKETT